MLYEVRKNSIPEQWFLIIFFVLSLLLSFSFGYVLFRYWQIEVCKSPIEVGQFDL